MFLTLFVKIVSILNLKKMVFVLAYIESKYLKEDGKVTTTLHNYLIYYWFIVQSIQCRKVPSIL